MYVSEAFLDVLVNIERTKSQNALQLYIHVPVLSEIQTKHIIMTNMTLLNMAIARGYVNII